MTFFIKISTIILSGSVLLCMIRAISGPETADRIIAVNVVCTKIIVIITMISFLLKESFFVDVALTYAMISFIASIIISKTIGAGEEQ